MSDDEAILRALRGAHFGPNASLILPSGAVLDAATANELVSDGERPSTPVRATAERLDRTEYGALVKYWTEDDQPE